MASATVWYVILFSFCTRHFMMFHMPSY